MALVIQSGEDEDIPEPPPDFPRCTSRSPSAVESYISGAAAIMPNSDTIAMSDSKQPIKASQSGSRAIPLNQSTTSGGIDFGSLQVLLVVLVIIVALAVVALPIIPIYMARRKRNMVEATERSHLLQENVATI